MAYLKRHLRHYLPAFVDDLNRSAGCLTTANIEGQQTRTREARSCTQCNSPFLYTSTAYTDEMNSMTTIRVRHRFGPGLPPSRGHAGALAPSRPSSSTTWSGGNRGRYGAWLQPDRPPPGKGPSSPKHHIFSRLDLQDSPTRAAEEYPEYNDGSP